MSKTPPLTPEQWAVVKVLRDHFGLTYKQVGDALGKSASLVKVKLNGYVQYRTPSGGWSIKKAGGEGATSDEGPLTG